MPICTRQGGLSSAPAHPRMLGYVSMLLLYEAAACSPHQGSMYLSHIELLLVSYAHAFCMHVYMYKTLKATLTPIHTLQQVYPEGPHRSSTEVALFTGLQRTVNCHGR